MINTKKISVIVPVFNEEKTVAGVIKMLLAMSSVDEVICVNDGSTDKSPEILREFGSRIIFIDSKINHGKGYALAEGIKKAQAEIVVFTDADTVGLEEKHVLQLVKPLLEDKKGRLRAVLGILGGVIKPFYLITGERAYFKKDLLPLLNDFCDSRFGVEILLNHKFGEEKRKIIFLKGARGLLKYEKAPVGEATNAYLKEGLEMVQEAIKIGGKWNEKYQKQLMKIKKAKTWKDLNKIIAKVRDRYLRRILKEYILGYARKIRKFFEQ